MYDPKFEITHLPSGQELPWDLLLPADPSREQVERYVYSARCCIAQLNAHVTGVMVLQGQNAEVMEIMNIAVREAQQGKGIGRKMLRYARQIAKTEGYLRLKIATGNSSIGQLALYQQEGFEISHIVKDYFVRHFPEPIFENGIPCRHQIVLEQVLLA